ncbi:MAG: uracil-DNA glycosylase [Crocinitomicaceae bacterium]|nr:uracil-DNA glycosylase [Crocinitomicaceae bacterium]
MKVKIDEVWNEALKDEFEKDYFESLVSFVKNQYASKTIYPPGNQIFSAFDSCPLDQLKVVIVGQDPYHGYKQANGMCFSVVDGIPHPPSLVNIFKEIETDLGLPYPTSGDLSRWAVQGVFLLNATLTVEAGNAGSHQRRGWETFTDAVIERINNCCENVVFMLWGGYAKRKGSKIDRNKHFVLESGHPSPLSANKGYWFGNKHFSRCNHFLTKQGLTPIDWA